MITNLDHIALAVKDLDIALERYSALLGREPEWIGADGGARHAWFQLENMALDVIAPTGPGLTGDLISARLKSHGEGPWAIAFGVEGAEKYLRVLNNRGVAAPPWHPLRVIREHGEEKRYWTMTTVDQAASAEVLTFLIDSAKNFAWPQAKTVSEAPVTGLDHAVIRTPNPTRALAHYGARLGLDLRMDRTAPEWGARLMFFRVGDLILEIAHDLKAADAPGPDQLWGLTWRVADADAAQARIAAAGFNVSEVRAGRKPGSRVFTVRDGTSGVPTLMIELAKEKAP
jgi:catechol 2,3-dioxygenase-like lactoylglutathione lyase family enzyme